MKEKSHFSVNELKVQVKMSMVGQNGEFEKLLPGKCPTPLGNKSINLVLHAKVLCCF